MGNRAKTQDLISRVRAARDAAGMPPKTITLDQLTIQEVEALTVSLDMPPFSILTGAAA